MSINYNWDYVTRAYTSMYKETENSDNVVTRAFADHALGMLKLIPLIRDIPELSNLSLDMSLGKLVLGVKSHNSSIYLSCNKNYIYIIQTYTGGIGFSETEEFDLEQIVPALQQVLKAITMDKS
jgi:hypothetical protein